MVSIRRTKLKGPRSVRSPPLASFRSIPLNNVPENPARSHKSANVQRITENPEQSRKPANVQCVPENPEQSRKPANVQRVPENPGQSCKPANVQCAPEYPGQSCKPANVHHVPENPWESCKPANVHHVPENPWQSCRPASVHLVPPLPSNQVIEVAEERDLRASPPAKRQKIHAKINPENPMEVHAYLMKLKEDKKLDLGPLRRSEEMPVKEWMEKCYPYIFRVFPQSPKMSFQFPNEIKQDEFLYSHYWLFLFEVRNIAFMDHRVSPDFVESLGKVMKNLETQGFDCRFLRSELLVVGYMMRKQQEIMSAEKNMIAKRTVSLEKELQDLARKKEKETELKDRGKELEVGNDPDIKTLSDQMTKLQKGEHKGEIAVNKSPFAPLEEEYVEVILERHKKMLACKEEEGKRLDQVLDKIKQMYQNR
ncbi:uncharacterized protein LOC126657547 [Mercurialis annua]|uniref:uncharacterized protein LOC126657547 n=1 Tax=Mercurialis annua TaxID=3986 RepID=UPI002160AFBC|nr:uncharacterized protein LOC126657547 [Mercurialis annua]